MTNTPSRAAMAAKAALGTLESPRARFLFQWFLPALFMAGGGFLIYIAGGAILAGVWKPVLLLVLGAGLLVVAACLFAMFGRRRAPELADAVSYGLAAVLMSSGTAVGLHVCLTGGSVETRSGDLVSVREKDNGVALRLADGTDYDWSCRRPCDPAPVLALADRLPAKVVVGASGSTVLSLQVDGRPLLDAAAETARHRQDMGALAIFCGLNALLWGGLAAKRLRDRARRLRAAG
ncbi:hypothetical protein ACFODL_12755 [Phenylobacterium terrae]|uniref:Uncharacterized protein n=1 Tax=Phenylobacterium terrae TaxID=2665495 RepID=A0ABW4N1N1_9CAUL